MGLIDFVTGVVAKEKGVVAEIDVASAVWHFFGKIVVEYDDVFGFGFVDGNDENGDVEIKFGECVLDNFDLVFAHLFVVMNDETIWVLYGVFVLDDGVFDGAG